MNILASYNWIKEYLKTDLTAAEFAKKTTAAGNSVEHMDVLADRFAHVVVGVVKDIKPHPNADKLRLVETDVGTGVVTIVCGGSNLETKQKVAVALPGSNVRWHGEGDWVELRETEIRGVKSAGMICAASELGFEKLGHADRIIWDITSLTKAKAGTPLASALDLDDVVMDIEVTSNRPDCMSIVGQAREGSAVTGGAFKWKSAESFPVTQPDKQALAINISAPDLCLKYEAVAIDGVKVGPSPWWLQKKLLLAGHRPVNNVVDVTNYVLHELGQPLHAFDADTLEGRRIIVRLAKTGESMVALDGKTYALTDKMLVIADASRPVAIAGVMGGMQTGTSEKTTRVIVESATFHPVSVRKTSRALTLGSDSSRLFEKGLSTSATTPALNRAVELMLTIAGGSVSSSVYTHQSSPYQAPHFPFEPAKAAALIGAGDALAPKDMLGMLKRLGFICTKTGKTYDVVVPYWRDHDIEGSRDFVEEIARLYGYANIPSVLPSGVIPATESDALLAWERRVKEFLRGSGLCELYGNSFVSAHMLERYAIPTDAAVKLQNPLTSDLAYMRPSLVPSLLAAVEENQRRRPSAVVFELAPAYAPNKNDIPDHRMRLVIASYGSDGVEAFRQTKGIVERLLRELGIRSFRLERGVDDQQFHPTRSAVLCVEGDRIGPMGQLGPGFAKAFGLESAVVFADLDFERLVTHGSTKQLYHPIPLFPEVKRDLAVVIDQNVEYATVERALKVASPLLHSVELFDIYRGAGVPEGRKSLAMHFIFRAHDRTLGSEEADREIKKLQDVLTGTFHAMIRA